MKQIRPFLIGLIGCVIALAITTASAEQGTAKVVRIHGAARYSTGNNVFQPLQEGMLLKAGTVIQTAANSYVDVVLYNPAATAPHESTATPVASTGQSRPKAKQDLVRISEDTVLGFDKLNVSQTGADKVTETQLDLRSGTIFASVKKLSAASTYEIKIPNGVAGVRGTWFRLNANGILDVFDGSVVISWTGPDGKTYTLEIGTVDGVGQEFYAPDGKVIDLPPSVVQLIWEFIWSITPGPGPIPTTIFTVDKTIYVVSGGPNEGQSFTPRTDRGGENP